MSFYQELKMEFSRLCRIHHILDERIEVYVDNEYSEFEGLQKQTSNSGPVLAGRSRLVGKFNGNMGISHTFYPTPFSGTIREILDIPMDTAPNRALVVSALNAVAAWSDPELRTLHCTEKGSLRCTRLLVNTLKKEGYSCPGLIGFQPVFMEKLGEEFGIWNTAVIDQSELNEETRKIEAIECADDAHIFQLFAWSDVVVATGATLISGTLPDIVEMSEITGVPLMFYGTSIAGTANLMNLNRFCPEARSIESTTEELFSKPLAKIA
jgi:hypothetical protein